MAPAPTLTSCEAGVRLAKSKLSTSTARRSCRGRSDAAPVPSPCRTTVRIALLSLAIACWGATAARGTPPTHVYPSRMVVEGQTAYVAWGGDDRQPRPIWAIDVPTGEKRWILPKHYQRWRPPHVARGRMFVDLPEGPHERRITLHVIDLGTGEVENRIPPRRNADWPDGPPVGNEDFYVTEKGAIIDCRTAEKIGYLDHPHNFGAAILQGRLYTLSGVGRDPPQLTARIIDLARNRVEASYLLPPGQPAPSRRFQCYGGDIRLLAARNTTGYFLEGTTFGGWLFAFDFATAKTDWRLELPVSGQCQAAWLDDQTLALPSDTCRFNPATVDVAQGKRVDRSPWGPTADRENDPANVLHGARACVSGEHAVAMVSSDSSLTCLNESDGKLRWRHELPEDLRATTPDLAICASHVVLLTPKGLLTADIETGAATLIEYPERSPQGDHRAFGYTLLTVVVAACGAACWWLVVRKRRANQCHRQRENGEKTSMGPCRR